MRASYPLEALCKLREQAVDARRATLAATIVALREAEALCGTRQTQLAAAQAELGRRRERLPDAVEAPCGSEAAQTRQEPSSEPDRNAEPQRPRDEAGGSEWAAGERAGAGGRSPSRLRVSADRLQRQQLHIEAAREAVAAAEERLEAAQAQLAAQEAALDAAKAALTAAQAEYEVLLRNRERWVQQQRHERERQAELELDDIVNSRGPRR